MNLYLEPGKLTGTLTPPPSKSQAHRLIIAASLAQGISHLTNVAASEDIQATLNCMAALGAEIRHNGGEIRGAAPHKVEALPQLDCGESGSTLRFLIPVALALTGGGQFFGRGRLLERPMKPYEELFQEKGVRYEHTPDCITAEGTLTPGVYRLPGNVSSQFITGLLYALPLLEGDSDLELTTELQSSGYVDMTLDALVRFGVTVQRTAAGWHIPGGQRYIPCDCAVESDYSQAANFLVANSLGSEILLEGLNPDSTQGDRVILDFVRRLDGPGEVTLDVSQCPDLVPPLALRAALRDGEVTHIVGAARLRMKESDRLDTVTIELNNLGGHVTQTPDSLTILGRSYMYGGVTDSHNDHRIAMMLGIAATRCLDAVTVCGAECVAKSYPNFWEDYQSLGGNVHQRVPTTSK
ncbi:MAG: 3-phosphoshikimate 1-carboxyvinyltransferase [Clostridiales bacterium]|nr:3-phosphoshikimate 1-carboxyvinyltransferase [Clostridiales bacterium]